MASTSLISLRTADGVVFEIERSMAKHMKTVQAFIDECPDTDVPVIPLHNVYSIHVTKILEFHRLSDAGNVKEFTVDEFDNYELKEFLLAVHFLNMDPLFEFLTKAVAKRIEKKSVEYVREYFGIENDFTPEEEARIREKNSWAFKGENVEVEEDEKES
ncbi:SKP1-like protein 14 [Cicer arietinum]|uniref:SKP1-like protein n=1 Tax=Cicer arietinum TaxID=3827 RepID=A0A1S2XA18_CICAR|nr:SKP1-like protein 14 [Cicer arietinum]